MRMKFEEARTKATVIRMDDCTCEEASPFSILVGIDRNEPVH